jgi:hypothetical protein
MSKAMRDAFLGAMVFLVCGLAPVRAQDADPLKWGVYAKLAGVERQAGPDGYRLRWRWVKPNEELAEDYILPRTGNVASTNTITPGEKPGTLVVTGSIGLGRKYWDGKILPDGSVDFIGRGIIKYPYRAVLLDDGSYELRGLNLANGVVTSAKPANARDHYSPVDSAVAAPLVAAAPKATANPADLVALTAGAATPSASATAAATPARDFGFLERYVGRTFVSDAYTVTVYREGNALALEFARGGGGGLGRFLVSLDATTATYSVVETTPASSPGGRTAYFDDNGALIVEFVLESYRYRFRFQAVDDGIQNDLFLALRQRFGRYGAFEPSSSHHYAPATDAALRTAAVNYQVQQAELRIREEEARERQRERERERNEEWTNNMNALNQGLQRSLAAATASEAQSRAALDATLQQAAQQAAYERQLAAQREQEQANARAADDARRAREATERQYEIARQFEAQQQAQQLAHRQAEQEAQRVAASRPVTQPPLAVASGNTSSVASCPKVYKSGVGASGYANTQAEAERWARRDMELQCPMARYSAGAMQCSQKKQGDIVNIDSKGHSSKSGEMTAWMCQAEYRCSEPSDQCAKGPARGSAQ